MSVVAVINFCLLVVSGCEFIVTNMAEWSELISKFSKMDSSEFLYILVQQSPEDVDAPLDKTAKWIELFNNLNNKKSKIARLFWISTVKIFRLGH